MNSDEPKLRIKAPWGFLFSALVLFGVALWQYQPFPLYAPTAWGVCGPILACGLALCLASRGILHPFWCLVVGVLFLFHPILLQPETAAFERGLLVETGLLVGLAFLFAMWHLAGKTNNQLVSMSGLWIVAMVLGGWIWLVHPYAGLVATISSVVSLLVFCATVPVASGRGKQRPATLNVIAMGLFGVASVVAPFLLAHGLTELGVFLKEQGVQIGAVIPATEFVSLESMLATSLEPSGQGLVSGWQPDQRGRWIWGNFWVIVALMGWGLWRSLARSWTQAANRTQPSASSLAIFVCTHVLASWLQPRAMTELSFVPLATFSIFLPVYGIGDLFHGLKEKLTLHPPDDESSPTRFSVDKTANQTAVADENPPQPNAEKLLGSSSTA